ncbi:MAG: DoxX family membrane protein [Cytophagaceae bacterium]|nr:DoxX family membrane protein [Cytophagaceae bacterium]
MDSRTLTFAQLFLRLALAVSFLSAVADRLGLWGLAGTAGVSWGNWENFVIYSNAVNSYLPASIGQVLAIFATAIEVVLAVLLLVGYQLKWTAICSGILLVSFAGSLSISFGVKPPLDYSVWTGAAASFLLSTVSFYEFSLDEYLSKK